MKNVRDVYRLLAKLVQPSGQLLIYTNLIKLLIESSCPSFVKNGTLFSVFLIKSFIVLLDQSYLNFELMLNLFFYSFYFVQLLLCNFVFYGLFLIK